MIIAMMWWMGNQSKEETQLGYVERALGEAYQYHFDKYIMHPDTCHINPKQIDGKLPIIKVKGSEIRLRRDDSIILNTMWVGVGDRENYDKKEIE